MAGVTMLDASPLDLEWTIDPRQCARVQFLTRVLPVDAF